MAKNFISNKDETVRMFKNPVLEWFSHIHWSIPLFLYVPVVFYFTYRALFIVHLGVLPFIGLFIIGVISWTFAEYVLHRWVFHTDLPGKIGRRIHFIVHGVHHDYPKDSKRLVMVPSLSIPLAFIFFTAFYLLFGGVYVTGFFPGFVAGYLFYDTLHYATHHYNFKNKFWLDLKQYHMLHHYMDSHNGYGVSSAFWDHVFRTTLKKVKSNTENTAEKI